MQRQKRLMSPRRGPLWYNRQVCTGRITVNPVFVRPLPLVRAATWDEGVLQPLERSAVGRVLDEACGEDVPLAGPWLASPWLPLPFSCWAESARSRLPAAAPPGAAL